MSKIKKYDKISHYTSTEVLQEELADKLEELIGKDSNFFIENYDKTVTVKYIIKKRRWWFNKTETLLKVREEIFEVYWRIPTPMLDIIYKYLNENWNSPQLIRMFSVLVKERLYKIEKWMKSKKGKK